MRRGIPPHWELKILIVGIFSLGMGTWEIIFTIQTFFKAEDKIL